MTPGATSEVTPEAVVEALQLPAQALLGHRVPKTLLVEHGAPTAADKRHIENGIEELRWVAALKPTTVGIALFVDDTREVLELAVLTLRLRPAAKLDRLTELVHRAIPYHLLLVTASDSDGIQVSLADKRWAQNDRASVVLDGDPIECAVTSLAETVRASLLESLSLVRQPRTHLYALYRGWIDGLVAAKAATITGEFRPPTGADHATDRAAALDECAALESRIASIRAAAAREKQLARQVELNLELRRVRQQLDAARSRL